MRSVKIGDLKAKLSAHLQMVRDGEEVVVCDRNEPVARIVPIRAAEFSEQERRLIARGIMTPPLRRRKGSDKWPEPPGDVPDEVMREIWRQEREGR
jgi:prevent-host-death family protein